MQAYATSNNTTAALDHGCRLTMTHERAGNNTARMRDRLRMLRKATILVVLLAANTALGQRYPTKAIRIVASEAGGGNDFIARQIAPVLAANVGQPVIVDNRGLVAPDIVAKAPPDAYTLLINGSQLWLLPFLREKVSYDPVRDFRPITLAVSSTGVLVVHPSLAMNSVRELIDAAKARPGQLNYASGALGAIPHLAAELFKNMAGVQITQIPYKGNGPAINDLLGGQVHLMFASSGSIAAHVRSGKVLALAVTSAQPSVIFPTLPTIAASGVPGYEAAALTGLFAPAGTPAPLIDFLNQHIVRALARPEIKDRFGNAGVEVIGSSAPELGLRVRSEMARLGKVIKDAGIRDE